MNSLAYLPPWWLRNGMLMTLYVNLRGSRHEKFTITDTEREPPYQENIFIGAEDTPIFGWVAIPENAHSTIIGTYGITGDLNNQWFLRLLGRKAYAQGFAVVLFDWRAHGKTAELSPTLTSDGLYEGQDFVCIAAQAKKLGCPAPFWFTGYSLGGQLALWGVKAAQESSFGESDIAGAAVICPSLDSNRSLVYLEKARLGRYLEKAIARNLKKLTYDIQEFHPHTFQPTVIEGIQTIRGFDEALVIEKLGFSSVEDYYNASSALTILPQLRKPTLILYAADDPMFDPTIVPDLQAICAENPALNLLLTSYGGHVGYWSSRRSQLQSKDPDMWWAWNRVLEWFHINQP